MLPQRANAPRDQAVSMMSATPARIHRAGGVLVLYVGHEYMPLMSALSAWTPLTDMTGMGENISFGFELSTLVLLPSQRAPIICSPLMYAPSRACPSTSSGVIFLLTSVTETSLSSSLLSFCAATWLIAVRNDCGLTRP